ncbi:MAG: glycosyltransferase family 39 protein [Chloroflexi bacterium]|nr:glycosyltransferase family 39 protein [Chloroflexota bacterium]
MKKSNRFSPYFMLPVLLLAMTLGAAGLNADIVWMDEMFSLGNMGAFDDFFSPAEVLSSLAQESPDHVPLYFVLGSQWARLVGWSQVAIRYLSLLFGMLLVASVYRLATDLDNPFTGLVAALLVSTCAMITLFTHEIRMYTLLAWLATAHTWLYWRLQSGVQRSGWTKISFVVTGILLPYIHVFSAFFFLGLASQHLIFAERSRRWWGIVAGWALAGLTFLPYIPAFAVGFIGVTGSERVAEKALSTPEVVELLAHLFVNDVLALWLPILILAGLALRRRRRWFLRILVMAVVMLGAIISLNAIFEIINITRFRYFVIVLPFFHIALAMMLAADRSARIVLAGFLLLWIFGAVQIWRQAEHWQFAGRNTLLMKHPPLHRLTDALMNKTRPHDHVLGFAGSPMISWRYKHGATTAEYYLDHQLGISGDFVNTRLRGDELRADTLERSGNHPYLLFTYDPLDKPFIFDDVFQVIEAEYKACHVVVNQSEVFVQRYVDPAIACDRAYEPIHYENGIKILDKYGEYDSERQRARVVTGWEIAHEAQLDLYNVSIQIITPEWQQVRQYGDRDRHLHNDVLKWYEAEMTTAGLPPGDYRVVVILYDRYDSRSKVSGIDLTTGETGAILPIFSFSIEE